MTIEHAECVILACCVLHNFLRTKALESFAATTLGDIVEHNGNVVNGVWRDDPSNAMRGIRGSNARNPPASAIDVRDHLMEYFNTIGSVAWQDAYVRRN